MGNYKVCVAPPPNEGMSHAEYEEMMDNESLVNGKGAWEDIQGAEDVIPAAFQSTGSSGLSFEVKEGKNIIDIEMKWNH